MDSIVVRPREQEPSAALRCPYCHDDILPEHNTDECPSCQAVHHRRCFRELRSCASCRAELPTAPLPRKIERPTPARTWDLEFRGQQHTVAVIHGPRAGLFDVLVDGATVREPEWGHDEQATGDFNVPVAGRKLVLQIRRTSGGFAYYLTTRDRLKNAREQTALAPSAPGEPRRLPPGIFSFLGVVVGVGLTAYARETGAVELTFLGGAIVGFAVRSAAASFFGRKTALPEPPPPL